MYEYDSILYCVIIIGFPSLFCNNKVLDDVCQLFISLFGRKYPRKHSGHLVKSQVKISREYSFYLRLAHIVESP